MGIISGSGSFQGQCGDHFVVGIISGAVQFSRPDGGLRNPRAIEHVQVSLEPGPRRVLSYSLYSVVTSSTHSLLLQGPMP